MESARSNANRAARGAPIVLWTTVQSPASRLREITAPSYSILCYSFHVSGKSELLREVMRETHTSQSLLSRLSGVHQPSISEFLSGRIGMSDDMLQRLLQCMEYEVQIVRTPKRLQMNRTDRRRWLLHRELVGRLSKQTWPVWHQPLSLNLERLRKSVSGQPHQRNLDRWQRLVEEQDLNGLRRVMLDPTQDGIEMREVSPMSGLLPDEDRLKVLRMVRT